MKFLKYFILFLFGSFSLVSHSSESDLRAAFPSIYALSDALEAVTVYEDEFKVVFAQAGSLLTESVNPECNPSANLFYYANTGIFLSLIEHTFDVLVEEGHANDSTSVREHLKAAKSYFSSGGEERLLRDGMKWNLRFPIHAFLMLEVLLDKNAVTNSERPVMPLAEAIAERAGLLGMVVGTSRKAALVAENDFLNSFVRWELVKMKSRRGAFQDAYLPSFTVLAKATGTIDEFTQVRSLLNLVNPRHDFDDIVTLAKAAAGHDAYAHVPVSVREAFQTGFREHTPECFQEWLKAASSYYLELQNVAFATLCRDGAKARGTQIPSQRKLLQVPSHQDLRAAASSGADGQTTPLPRVTSASTAPEEKKPRALRWRLLSCFPF